MKLERSVTKPELQPWTPCYWASIARYLGDGSSYDPENLLIFSQSTVRLKIYKIAMLWIALPIAMKTGHLLHSEVDIVYMLGIKIFLKIG